MQTDNYDVAVIGAGQGGSIAKQLALAGRKTALIERRWWGGSCINWGCTPTKLMVTTARVAHMIRRAKEFGISTSEPVIDMNVVRQQKREIIEEFSGDYLDSVSGIDNLDLILGEASFDTPKELHIALKDGGEQQIHAELIIIAVGSLPTVPQIDGLTESDYLTLDSLMELEEVPEHLVVIGGGVIGSEFSQMFRRFGAKVTMIQRNRQLLSKENADVGEELKKIFRSEGIEVLTGAVANKFTKNGDRFTLSVQQQDGIREVSGSHLFIAAGHTPNSERLRLENAGIRTDEHGYITVNPALETNVEGIYAMGDVKGGPAFTHIAYDDTRILQANLIHGENRTIEGRVEPHVIFTDPQIGHVGLTEREARQQNTPIRVAKITLDQTARGIETKELQGFLKAIVHAETQQILGATVFAFEGGEVLGAIQVAIQAKLPYTFLRENIFSHPTMVEAFNNLFLAMDRENA